MHIGVLAAMAGKLCLLHLEQVLEQSIALKACSAQVRHAQLTHSLAISSGQGV